MRLRLKEDPLLKEIWESKLEHFVGMRKSMRKEYADLKLSVDKMSLFLGSGTGGAGGAVSVRGLYEERYGAASGVTGVGGGSGINSEFQNRVHEQNRQMADGVEILVNANRQMAESEDTAIETLANLNSQRETIEHSRMSMRTVTSELERAGGFIFSMAQRNAHRKREIYLFLFVIGLLLLGLLIYTQDESNLAIICVVVVIILGLVGRRWCRKRWRSVRGAEFSAALMGERAADSGVNIARNWIRPGE